MPKLEIGHLYEKEYNMSYRPITDLWLLTRCRYKDNIPRYGGYLGGFPERARVLIGANINDPVLHVCGGKAKLYPYSRGFGPNDKTLDLDPDCQPDFLQDARDHFPWCPYDIHDDMPPGNGYGLQNTWAGILIDPPYSPEDAAHYSVGADKYPSPSLLIKNAFEVLPVGGKCGLIHYILPKPPKNSVFVACVGVVCGYNNRGRLYSVFEKLK